ncbi:MAG: tetratricopeptide repeat protein [Rhodospirillales bacterium]|nr:tetratricopeptide repeat protein [Rhodospirillales bacterium]
MPDTDLLSRALEHHQSGRLEDAKAIYLQLLDENPDDPDALNYLGVFECQVQQFDRAEELLQRSLQINPDNPKAHNNLGNVLRLRGRFDHAEAAFRRAYELDPDNDSAHFNCATVMLQQGKAEEAGDGFRKAASINPKDPQFARGLAACAVKLDELGIKDERLRDDLIHVFSFDGIDTGPLRRIASVLIVQRPEIERLLSPPGQSTGDRVYTESEITTVIKDRLLTRTMARDHLVHTSLERLLVGVRRQCLERLLDGTLADVGEGETSVFLAALAQQCFINEYVFAETSEEKKSLETLEDDIDTAIKAGNTPDPDAIFVLAAYRPLAHTGFTQALARRDYHEADPLLSAVIQRQVIEPLEEGVIAASLPRLTPIQGLVSQEVQRQYEENPYPRWQNLDPRDPIPLATLMKRRFGFLDIDAADFPTFPRILVAGSGTGREPAMTAREYKNSSVLAVDLSLSSLAFGARMAARMGINNIEFAQADIMEMGALEREFDVIFCSGVLHHLADPIAGWKILSGLLAKQGVMSVALYSKHARQSVTAARDFIAAGGYTATPDGIRRCRTDIMALEDQNPGNNPVGGVMNNADFYAMSPCRDLIFHVQEHQFTIPAIAEALNTLGLRFLGFETNPSVLARYRQQFPDDKTLTDLENWSRMESADPSLFWNMYQFWTMKA